MNAARTFPGVAAVVAFLVAPGPVRADEGMFLPHRFGSLPMEALKRRGLALTAAQIKALSPAIVQLAQGGTGSFVSPEGLIVTNHHVAYRCLVHLDGTAKHKGIMDRGVVARSRSDEIPCPGYDALVVVRMEDATSRVLSAVTPGMSPKKRFVAVMVAKRKLEAQCEKAGGLVCSVRELNGGAGFTLSAYRRIEDVRLVYAPPKDLGKYGGDIDNWRYPRHTADFAFLRAYVTPKGDTSEPKPTNVPFRPATFLKVATTGVKRSDFVMVMGFPGRTLRHATLYRALYHRDHLITQKARLFRDLLKVVPTQGLSGRRYQGLEAGLNNAAKYYEDLQKQFVRFGFVQRKSKEHAALVARAGGQGPKAAASISLLHRIRDIYVRLGKLSGKIVLLDYLTGRLLKSLQTALDIVQWSRLKKVPDIRREDERYREKNLFRVHRQSRLLEQMTTAEGEKAVMTRMFQLALKLPASQQIRTAWWVRDLGQREAGRIVQEAARRRRVAKYRDPVKTAVDLIYARTKIYPSDVSDKRAVDRARKLRASLFKASASRIRRSKDPLVRLAFRLAEEYRRFREGPLLEYEKVLAPILRPTLVKELIRPRYFDANFTLRLSYGTVADYKESATGKVWRYLSRLTWLVRRNRGKYPFRVPAPLLSVYARKDFGRWVDPAIRDVPVNFTATLDTTGGNSGSPVLNGRGELVGLLFDGTPESILSDWQYTEQEQRSICVDIRIALFLADKVDRASYILREVGIR